MRQVALMSSASVSRHTLLQADFYVFDVGVCDTINANMHKKLIQTTTTVLVVVDVLE